MGNRISRMKLLLFVVIFAIVTAVVGCSDNSTGSEDNNTETNKGGNSEGADNENSEEPIEISTLQPYWGDMPDEDGPLFKKIEEIMNADISPQFVQGPNMMDKVNVTLSSGQLPEILVVFMGNQPSIINAIRAGAFWDVGSYLDDYPNLKGSRDEIRDSNISVDGKVWALYHKDSIAREGFNMREDWLNNLGLEQPKTIDELYNVLKAFTYDDPDQNGKDDTLGLATVLSQNAGNIPAAFKFMISKFGAPNNYKVEDGKFIPDFTTEEYRETMKFFKKLYDEGIMNQDFTYAKLDQVLQMVRNDEAGVWMGNMDQIWDPLFDINPDAKMLAFSDLEGPNYQYAKLGYWSTLMFPKSSVETEEELHKILAGLDRLAAPENKEFRSFGIEGVNYELQNDEHVFIEETTSRTLENLGQIFMTDVEVVYEGKPEYIVKQLKAIQENEEDPGLIGDPSTGIISDTKNKLGNELQTMIGDAVSQYIIGDIDDAGFDQVIEDWRAAGGDQMLKEFEEAYKNK
ncbi:hypothetical protein [Radiobacillus sp. PE A8.2]|uniref:hypothetical protein n=1 Tax=Radiobacillus sp. PE A8.2 TaxID=3380349 RepID=UPI00388CF0F7